MIMNVLLFIVLIGAAVLARKSLRQGRGDRRGAARLALFIFALIILNWMFGADHAPTSNAIGSFMLVAVSQALLGSGIVWLMYIGLEPYVRRRLPETIISWNRVLAGNISDPLVARDVLIGILLGIGMTIFPSTGEILRLWAGIPPENYAAIDPWLSASQFASGVFGSMSGAILASLGYLFLIFLLYAITRRRWLAGLVTILVLTIPPTVNSDGPIITAAMVALYWVLVLSAYFRIGLLAVATGNVVLYLLHQMPMGIDLTAWHSSYMIAALAGFLAVSAWAFHTSLGGQKVFTGSLLED